RSLLWLAAPLLALSAGVALLQAVGSARRASFPARPASRFTETRLRGLTALLHVLQPMARLWGRIRFGLTPWRRTSRGFALPWPNANAFWTEFWVAPERRVQALAEDLRSHESVVRHGGDFDGWDLEILGGGLGSARLLVAVEEHRGGTQIVRIR